MCLLSAAFIRTDSFALDRKSPCSAALSHYIMATVRENFGDMDNAVYEYKKALSADFESSAIHLGLASAYIKKNNIPQAVGELNFAATYDPQAVEPRAILTLLYSVQNNPKMAAHQYEIALKNASILQPKNVDIYKSQGVIYLRQERWQEAESVYKTILDISDQDSQAHFYLGGIYNKLKKSGLAEKELKRALELKPDYHEALNFLGYLYVEENTNLLQAEAMIRKALEMSPENGAYVDSLGWFYFKKGRYQEAIKMLEKASLLADNPVIYDHLGDGYQKINDFQKAKINWEESLRLDPKQKRIRDKIEGLNKSLMINAVHRYSN